MSLKLSPPDTAKARSADAISLSQRLLRTRLAPNRRPSNRASAANAIRTAMLFGNQSFQENRRLHCRMVTVRPPTSTTRESCVLP